MQRSKADHARSNIIDTDVVTFNSSVNNRTRNNPNLPKVLSLGNSVDYIQNQKVNDVTYGQYMQASGTEIGPKVKDALDHFMNN